MSQKLTVQLNGCVTFEGFPPSFQGVLCFTPVDDGTDQLWPVVVHQDDPVITFGTNDAPYGPSAPLARPKQDNLVRSVQLGAKWRIQLMPRRNGEVKLFTCMKNGPEVAIWTGVFMES